MPRPPSQQINCGAPSAAASRSGRASTSIEVSRSRSPARSRGLPPCSARRRTSPLLSSSAPAAAACASSTANPGRFGPSWSRWISTAESPAPASSSIAASASRPARAQPSCRSAGRGPPAGAVTCDRSARPGRLVVRGRVGSSSAASGPHAGTSRRRPHARAGRPGRPRELRGRCGPCRRRASPRSRAWLITVRTLRVSRTDSAAVGSSSRSRRAPKWIARVIASDCFSPPEEASRRMLGRPDVDEAELVELLGAGPLHRAAAR